MRETSRWQVMCWCARPLVATTMSMSFGLRAWLASTVFLCSGGRDADGGLHDWPLSALGNAAGRVSGSRSRGPGDVCGPTRRMTLWWWTRQGNSTPEEMVKSRSRRPQPAGRSCRDAGRPLGPGGSMAAAFCIVVSRSMAYGRKPAKKNIARKVSIAPPLALGASRAEMLHHIDVPLAELNCSRPGSHC